MYRLILSASVVVSILVTTQALGQQPGAFLLVDRPATNLIALTDSVAPAIPQSTEVKEKNPWAAFFYSWLIPGGGQFYNDQGKKGLLMLTGAATGIGFVIYGINDKQEESSESITRTATSITFSSRYEESSNDSAITIGAAIYLGSALWSMIDAPVSANKINQELRQTSLQINPVIADDLAGVSLTLKF